MATNNAVNVGLAGATGTGNFVGSTSPSITTPRVITSVNDTNNNELIKVTATGSAVNEITVANAATGNSPVISATGDNTDIILTLNGKGTGGVAILGTSTNDSPAAGYVGEFVSSILVTGSAVSLTTATAANVTSISITAGDWIIYGNVAFLPNAATTTDYVTAWTSSTSATIVAAELRSQLTWAAGTVLANSAGMYVPLQHAKVTGATTIYLSCQAAFAVNTMTACGGIFAIRIR